MSTTLPHGIIQINEGNIAWYGDITANWQLIDSKIGVYDAAIANIPAPANNGTLTINYGGTTLAIFGADDAGNVSADIPAPGDGTLTVTQGGSTLGTFSANQATPETIDIPAPGDGTLTVTQGGSTLGSFSANQAAAETIDIPAPGDGTLTIKVNGSTAGTFTANQSTAATANITVPTAVSELVNDSGYLTSSSNLDASKLTSGTVDIARLPQGALERLVKVANEAARYALTTADVQLGDTVQQLDTGIMYVVTDTDHLDSAAGYTEYTAGTAASVPWSGVTGKPTFAAVATSGAYSDLTGTPTIPTVNDATLTIQQNGTNVQTFTANQATAATANIQCVDLSTAQTVAGIKTFISNPGVSRANDPYYHLTTTGYDKGTSPASNLFSGVRFFCNPDASAANKITGGLNMAYYANGYNAVELNARNYDENDNHRFFTVSLRVSNDSTVPIDFVPSVDATINLGSSAAQWNNAYVKALTVNGTAAGDILTHNAADFVDVTSAQTIAGDKDFTGTTGTHDVIPATTDTYDLGSSTKEYNNAYAKTVVVTGGITLDNKAIDTDANGDMTFNGNKVLTNANLTFSYDSTTETLTVTY